jgi:hypothetical protein
MTIANSAAVRCTHKIYSSPLHEPSVAASASSSRLPYDSLAETTLDAVISSAGENLVRIKVVPNQGRLQFQISS